MRWVKRGSIGTGICHVLGSDYCLFFPSFSFFFLLFCSEKEDSKIWDEISENKG